MAEGDLIQPTREEAFNGWTPETLTAYVHKQGDRFRRVMADGMHARLHGKRRPKSCNTDYDPRRW